MSKENLEQFMSKVADSEELQAKIGEEIDAEALIALGAECGCEFTAEELSEAAELTDDELDSIAGGVGMHIDPPVVWHVTNTHKLKIRLPYQEGGENNARVTETGSKHPAIAGPIGSSPEV